MVLLHVLSFIDEFPDEDLTLGEQTNAEVGLFVFPSSPHLVYWAIKCWVRESYTLRIDPPDK